MMLISIVTLTDTPWQRNGYEYIRRSSNILKIYPDILEVLAKKPLLLYKFLRGGEEVAVVDHTQLFDRTKMQQQQQRRRKGQRRSDRIIKKRRIVAPGNAYWCCKKMMKKKKSGVHIEERRDKDDEFLALCIHNHYLWRSYILKWFIASIFYLYISIIVEIKFPYVRLCSFADHLFC